MTLRDDGADVLAALAAADRLRRPRLVDTPPGEAMHIDAAAVHDFSSNDYLGLARDKRLQEAAIEVMRSSGFGASASRLILTHRVHAQLEAELASWLAAERAQLFNSGYAANVGVLSTIAGQGDVIFSDELNHASIIDGCRLSRASVVVFRHGDLEDLRAKVGQHVGRRRFVVSESVFSMDGDVIDVQGLRDIAREAGAALILDEAHAIGVWGPEGRGIAAQVGVVPDVLVGTLGKAFGCFGAFAATSNEVADWLWNRARSLVFSTGLPPMVSGAALQALKILRSSEGDALRRLVAENVQRAASGLGLRCESHIVPWVVGADADAVSLSRRLLQRGLFVQAIRPPTVPDGTARLRISLGTQPKDAVEQLLRGLREATRD